MALWKEEKGGQREVKIKLKISIIKLKFNKVVIQCLMEKEEKEDLKEVKTKLKYQIL